MNLSTLHHQVFKNPYEVVTVLLIQTLGAMVPSIPVCLSTAMERTPQEQRMDTLLELHHTAATFGRSLEQAMLPHLGRFTCYYSYVVLGLSFVFNRDSAY